MKFSSITQERFTKDTGLSAIRNETENLRILLYHLYDYKPEQLYLILSSMVERIENDVDYIETGEFSNVVIS